MTPLVSVVTPCLNPGDALSSCLASVAAQTHPAVEHLVIDGGSADGTPELLRAAGVRFVSEPDAGQSAALNKGFALASGDLVGWLNADDELTPHAASAVVDALAAAPGAGWAYGNCEIVEADGASTVRRSRPVAGPESFFEANPIAQPGAFVAREALDHVGGVDESLELSMDFDLWLRLVDAGYGGVYVARTLARFTISSTSKTGSRPWSGFLREEALALWKTGRKEPASAKLGRAAAWAAHEEGAGSRAALRRAVAAALAWAEERDLGVDRRTVDGCAAVAAAKLERPHGASSLLHVARAAPWLARSSRRELLERLRRSRRS